jgi:uncharacterized protein (TIGR03437 family)
MRSNALHVLCLAACLPVSGQQINCTLKKGPMATIRKEGCNELVQAQLFCTGGTPTPPGQNVPRVDITFTADATIANGPNSVTVTLPNLVVYPDATAIIDQPPESAQGNFTAGPYNGVGGAGVNYNDGSFPNTFSGVKTGANSVTFHHVLLDPSPNGRTITVSFWIRACDENGNTTDPWPLFLAPVIELSTNFNNAKPMRVDAAAATTYAIAPSQLDLGGDLNCFVYQAIAGSAPANNALNTGLLGSSPSVPSAASATLNFSTLFPDCLRVRATGFQDVVGQFYNTDLGFTSPIVPPIYANYGTELQAVFNKIPAGVSVFVETSVTNAVGTVLLTSPGTAAGSTGLTQIPVTNGTATAIWETQTASITATGTFGIPVYFAYQSGVASPAHITVVQSLGSPTGGVQFVQPPASLIQPVLFSINTGTSTTPKLTATVDSRPCILGVTFWTNNACTHANGLFVSVVSDSASVQETSITFTTAGGLTNFALTPYQNTPIFSQIFPNATNATPGTYQETINFAGQGGANPLSVPFTVTVLPPNNPVFELNAVFDAFSYQSETIAPGQIYTIFGTNFGPSTLATGTLDASGKLGATVGNTQVLFDGVASPLLYVANGQLSGVAPFELAGKTSTNVQIAYNGLKSPVVAIPVVPASISIASADSSGGGGAVVLNKDGTLNTASNPASAGDTVVIYAAYAGPFAGGVTGTDGRTTTGAPYPTPAGTPAVTIGGVAATNIPYFGNAPGLLESVMQINVVIPAGVPSSPYNSLVISAGGVSSAGWTTIAVQ